MIKLVVVGLGNVGTQYRHNRHNVGSLFIDYLANTKKLVWKESPNCFWTIFVDGDYQLTLLKLKTFMNLSGFCLKRALTELQLTSLPVVVCVDNADLKHGKIKFSKRLSDNGHKGVMNIKDVLLIKKIYALHLGVDKKEPTSTWVLSDFNDVQQKLLFNVLFPKLTKSFFLTWNKWDGETDFVDLFNKFWHQNKRQPRHLAIIGGQWGDEGKGKIVDYFASKNYSIVARFSGGDNAGHTIKIKKKVYHFSILPVSIIQSEVTSVIGRGCLVNLVKLVEELTFFQKQNQQINLKISGDAHLVLPYHLLLDELQEKARQEHKIGTTKRGIGPCLQDKVGRFGIQVRDLFAPEVFAQKLKQNLIMKNKILEKIYEHQPLAYKAIFDQHLHLFAKIKQYVSDVFQFCLEEKEKSILFEGAQGTMLDINFGSYPFVTSTATVTWQIGNSFGSLCNKTTFLGVFKAYSTRVGAGAMPTEFDNQQGIGKEIVIKGNEIGVVTKRKRRVGWFDAVLAKRSCQINGFHQVALTLLDVLSGFKELKICIVHEQHASFQYITLKGWSEDLSQIKNYNSLPENAKIYVETIEKLIKVPITLISVGPERNQVILRNSQVK